MEQEECCILGICCDPKLRREALATKLQRDVKHYPLTPEQATEVADVIMDSYDLAPHNLLMPLIEYVAEEAREYPYQKS